MSPFAPGGLGVREAVLTTLLAPIYGLGAAAVIAVGLRLVHMAADLLASGVIELGHRLRPRSSLLQSLDDLASRPD